MNHEQIISKSLLGLHEAVVMKSATFDNRLNVIESNYSTPTQTLGERIVENKTIKNFLSKKSTGGVFKLKQHEIKTAIIGDHSQNQALRFTSQPPIAIGATRKLFLRDILLSGRTDQGAIEYPIETSFTNNAGVQVGGSPEQFENVPLGESGFTFNLSFQPVITIGHWLNTSKQVLQDSGVLNAFLQNRLLYGLRLAEENQILNGTSANGQLSGLLQAATSYLAQSPTPTTSLMKVRDMLLQLELADYSGNVIILNPTDWFSIETSNSIDPRNTGQPSLWNIPVISTNAIAKGTACVMDASRSAVLFDRNDPEFLYSYKHSNNMIKNLVTLKVDERVSLVVTNPLGIVSGAI